MKYLFILKGNQLACSTMLSMTACYYCLDTIQYACIMIEFETVLFFQNTYYKILVHLSRRSLFTLVAMPTVEYISMACNIEYIIKKF